jgi:uncharacterized protein with FMN-binding domain
MRKSPIVIVSTAAGLVGLMGFHSTPAKITLGTLATTTTKPSSGGVTTTTQSPTGVRSATGDVVNYYYGTLSVKVTANGSRITAVDVASLNDGGNGYSAYVDQQSIPQLKREALAAQSASIQGVSGASYTSQGFQQSLQSALSKLGL